VDEGKQSYLQPTVWLVISFKYELTDWRPGSIYTPVITSSIDLPFNSFSNFLLD